MRKVAAVLMVVAFLAGVVSGAEPEEPAYLGVTVRDSGQPESGVLILAVVPGSPAFIAGLRAGDRILAPQEGNACGVDCFGDIIRAAGPGNRVKIRFVRNGRPDETEAILGRSAAIRFPEPRGSLEEVIAGGERSEVPEVLIRSRLEVILADLPEAPELPEIFLSPASRIGLDLIQVTPELRSHLGGPQHAGLLVGTVRPGSPAELAGITAGDLVVEVEGRPVRGGDGWVILLNTIDRSSFQVDLVRDGQPRTVAVELPQRAVRGDHRSLAVQNALDSIESSLESQEMSQDLREHLQAVREQLQRALRPPPKARAPAPEPAREPDPPGR